MFPLIFHKLSHMSQPFRIPSFSQTLLRPFRFRRIFPWPRHYLRIFNLIIKKTASFRSLLLRFKMFIPLRIFPSLNHLLRIKITLIDLVFFDTEIIFMIDYCI